jgi:hypothetical protein
MNLTWQDPVAALLVVAAGAYVVRRVRAKMRRSAVGCPGGCSCPVRAFRAKRCERSTTSG